MAEIRKVGVIGGTRIPFCRTGSNYAKLGNMDLMTATLQGLVKKFRLEGKILGDVGLGGVMQHSAEWNISREAVLGSGLDAATPGFVITRACGTGLEAALQIANKIAVGQIESGIGGGFDTMSEVPIAHSKKFAKKLLDLSRAKTFGEKLGIIFSIRLSDFAPLFPAIAEPRTNKTMGQHCEMMAKTWKITRQEQDEFALASHKNAAAAYERGFYNDLLYPYAGATKDNNVRGDTTMEKLAKLKPAFDRGPQGTLTAGNSSALTDGASAVLLASEDWAKKNGQEIQAYFVDAEVAGVDFVQGKEGLLMAPAYAVPRLLARHGLKLQDFDFYEIHEAFAAQVLCTLKAWESDEFCKNRLGLSQALGKIDRAKLNVVGSSVALGHPFGATGGRIVATLAKLLKEKGKGRGLISICTGGGMGVTAILER